MNNPLNVLKTPVHSELVPTAADPQTAGFRFWTHAELVGESWFIVEAHGDPTAEPMELSRFWVAASLEVAIEQAVQQGLGNVSLLACVPSPISDGCTHAFGEVEEVFADASAGSWMVRFRDGRNILLDQFSHPLGTAVTRSLQRLYVTSSSRRTSLTQQPA
jgi:hypothetical protein